MAEAHAFMGGLGTDEVGRGGARELLLEATSALMRERDALQVSLSDIAARAGVNAALVKYYFGSKLGLQMALLDRDLTVSMRQLRGLPDMDLSASKKMRMSLAAVVRLYFERPYVHQLIMATMREGDEAMRRDIADRFLKPLCDTYERLIEEGVAAGEFKPIDPRIFYFTIIGACDQIFTSRFVLKYVHGLDANDPEIQREYIQQTVKLLMEGMCA